ncbi:hypothetical protein [Noviherbaspirillum saxi]|uniref:Porin n=1 Tax=Noviherbaspirillum saxi TaxID=2320863 RepID=A0A3A3FEG1_9BURK|nr:hypothetical protein [Noviherbaspirillum saxi]RJF91741.1 hypothetical protein D3871_23905 [Noviherbaspirillum saxi]
MKSGTRRSAVCLLVLSFSIHSASAADETDAAVKLRGFGTIGAAHSSLKQADFVGSPLQDSGAGATHKWAFGVDSKLGLQLDARLTDRLDGVVQVVSQQRSDVGYRPQVEWAYLKYEIAPDFLLRAGRVILPAFMVSESRLVGYANHWARPPIESYNLSPFSNSDGVDVSYQSQLGSGRNTIQLIYGNLDAEAVDVTPRGTEILRARFRDIVAINDTYEIGNWTWRAAAITGKAHAPSLDSRLKFFNLGVGYDVGNWFVQAELSRLLFPGAVRPSTARYVTLGLRQGSLTPYLIYSSVASSDSQVALLPNDQRSYSAGVRWDFSRQASVKLQLDRVSIRGGAGGNGFFINTRPDFVSGSGATVVSAVIDFTF